VLACIACLLRSPPSVFTEQAVLAPKQVVLLKQTHQAFPSCVQAQWTATFYKAGDTLWGDLQPHCSPAHTWSLLWALSLLPNG